MTTRYLLQRLDNFSDRTDRLFSSEGTFSISFICHVACKLRQVYIDLRSSHVVLNQLDPLKLIIALIAFDGFTDAMLLLSNDASFSDYKNVFNGIEFNTVEGLEECISCLLLDSNEISREINWINQPDTIVTDWLLATSGTTGKPKIVVHKLNSLARTVIKGASAVKYTGDCYTIRVAMLVYRLYYKHL